MFVALLFRVLSVIVKVTLVKMRLCRQKILGVPRNDSSDRLLKSFRGCRRREIWLKRELS